MSNEASPAAEIGRLASEIDDLHRRLVSAETELASIARDLVPAGESDAALAACVGLRNHLHDVLRTVRTRDTRRTIGEVVGRLEAHIERLKANGWYCHQEPTFALASFAGAATQHAHAGLWGLEEPVQIAPVAALLATASGRRLVAYIRQTVGSFVQVNGTDAVVLPTTRSREIEMAPGVWSSVGNNRPVVDAAEAADLHRRAVAYTAKQRQRRELEAAEAATVAREAAERQRAACRRELLDALADPDTRDEIRELLSAKE